MRRINRGILVVLMATPGVLAAQEPAAASGSVRAALESRGLPQPLALAVDSIAIRAAAQGLPSGPLADKAIEGWAKHVPAPRIVAAVSQFAGRMGDARAAVRGAGLAEPPGNVISAAAEAMASGISGQSIARLVRAAPQPGIAAPAITVAAALHAQGFSPDQAVSVVSQAERQGRSMTDILDLPSAARAMQAEGLTPTEVGHRILDGNPMRGPGGAEGGSGSDGGGGGGREHGGDGGGGGTPPLPQPPMPRPRPDGSPLLPHP